MKQHDFCLQGSFMAIHGIGVLLTGRPGVGKSELALGLVTQGHRLVADDAPLFSQKDDHLVGRCPDSIRDQIEIRGLGIMNLRGLYGDAALAQSARLDLIIELDNDTGSRTVSEPEDRVFGVRRLQRIGTLMIPQRCLPMAPGRNLPLLADTLVRQFRSELDSDNSPA